ncbi:MAG: RNA polymerase sigma factor [Mycobacterium leprae]
MAKPWEATVRAAQNGDSRAFAALVHDFSDYVYHIAYSVLWQAEDAEDVAQESFLKAYTSLGQLREAGAFATWLARIAVNLARDRLRRRGEASLLDDLPPDAPELVAPTGPPDEWLVARETQAAVQAAIAALPNYYRTPLLLRVRAGLTYEEIAAVLAIPIGTVRSRIHAARDRLASALAATNQSTKEGAP